MKRLRNPMMLLAALGFLGARTSCSLFKKDDEDDGLTRWNDSVEKPSRFERWKRWEDGESDKMWRRFRDG